MSGARRRQALIGMVGLLGLAGAATGGALLFTSVGDGAEDRAAGTTTTPSVASPVLDASGVAITPTAEPTFVATDPASTVTAPPPRGSSPNAVQVLVTHATWDDTTGVSVAGFVDQTVELGGTCTLTLSHDGSSVTTSTTAEPGASSTSCGSLVVPPAQVSAGEWRAVLEYSSATSRGASEAETVTVP